MGMPYSDLARKYENLNVYMRKDRILMEGISTEYRGETLLSINRGLWQAHYGFTRSFYIKSLKERALEQHKTQTKGDKNAN